MKWNVNVGFFLFAFTAFLGLFGGVVGAVGISELIHSISLLLPLFPPPLALSSFPSSSSPHCPPPTHAELPSLDCRGSAMCGGCKHPLVDLYDLVQQVDDGRTFSEHQYVACASCHLTQREGSCVFAQGIGEGSGMLCPVVFELFPHLALCLCIHQSSILLLYKEFLSPSDPAFT